MDKKNLFKYKGPANPFKKPEKKEKDDKEKKIQETVESSPNHFEPDTSSYKGKRQQQADSGIIEPLFFFKDEENHKIKPIYNIDDHPNDKYKFAILRTTENGKYVVGNLLYFKLNGVEITTELNNVIFVDLLNKSVFIKQFDKVTETVDPVDPEERQYIIMMCCIDPDTGEQEYRWEAMTGRSTMYKYIADNEDYMGIDPDTSLVLTENVPYKDSLTVRQFVRYVKNKGMFVNDGLEFEDDSEY